MPGVFILNIYAADKQKNRIFIIFERFIGWTKKLSDGGQKVEASIQKGFQQQKSIIWKNDDSAISIL